MNLIDGTVSGGVFAAPHTGIPGLDAPEGPVTLGFRAEDAQVVPSGGQINAPIYTLELLGDATMVTVRIGHALVSVARRQELPGRDRRHGVDRGLARDLPPLRRKER